MTKLFAALARSRELLGKGDAVAAAEVLVEVRIADTAVLDEVPVEQRAILKAEIDEALAEAQAALAQAVTGLAIGAAARRANGAYRGAMRTSQARTSEPAGIAGTPTVRHPRTPSESQESLH
ncbi:MAG: hypothetical protein JST92_17950 [Deltaproteobacteria bacterium]|nr:hypothetical protein [Deltaproteobacteria bacterium]